MRKNIKEYLGKIGRGTVSEKDVACTSRNGFLLLLVFLNIHSSQASVATPVILVTWEARIGRIMI
jgi:hypothetical protein